MVNPGRPESCRRKDAHRTPHENNTKALNKTTVGRGSIAPDSWMLSSSPHNKSHVPKTCADNTTGMGYNTFRRDSTPARSSIQLQADNGFLEPQGTELPSSKALDEGGKSVHL